jgi:carbonic anhydrase
MKILNSGFIMLLLAGCATDTAFMDDPNKTRGVLKNMTLDNQSFVQDHTKEDFASMFQGQTPRAVVLACSDSRFHTHAVDKTPDNDLFVIRNIGNQLRSNLGSVMYAVKHLKTQNIIVIGHDSCGAVTAATSGIHGLEYPIQAELKHMSLPIHKKNPSPEDIQKNIEENVHRQIHKVMGTFKKEIKHDNLNVFGAIYDFKNIYGKGYGALVFVNWNGEKNKEAIARKASELTLDQIKIY